MKINYEDRIQLLRELIIRRELDYKTITADSHRTMESAYILGLTRALQIMMGLEDD